MSITETRERCSRCDRPATEDIFCARHYEVFLNSWSCSCGEINNGRRRTCAKCGTREDSL